MTGERDSSPRGGLRAVHEHLHHVAYTRLGIRYARLIAAVDGVGLLHLVLLVTTATWPLYIDMSWASAIRIVLAVQLLFAGVSVAAWRVALRLVRPIDDWIGAPDDKSGAAGAWTATVEFPFAFFRAPSILLAALLASVGATTYAGFELDLAWYEALVLLAGLGVALATYAPHGVPLLRARAATRPRGHRPGAAGLAPTRPAPLASPPARCGASHDHRRHGDRGRGRVAR